MSVRETPELRSRSSRFVEIFRTTPPRTICPNFYVLAHANGCGFNPMCVYCYLRSHFSIPARGVAFSNTDKLLQDVRKWIATDDLESYVLNSGNLCDSLVFEDNRPVVNSLMKIFHNVAKNRPHCLLIVTKGGMKECRVFFANEPCDRVIISFSLNHPEAAEKYESGAPPVAERMAAAGRLKEQGWRLRLRIDPIIEGYDYRELAGQVRELEPERLTLGTLRAERGLFRFVHADIFERLECNPDPKGLSRYPSQKRVTLYRQVLDIVGPGCSTGLCEETPEMWTELGLDPDHAACNCGS